MSCLGLVYVPDKTSQLARQNIRDENDYVHAERLARKKLSAGRVQESKGQQNNNTGNNGNLMCLEQNQNRHCR